VACKKEVDKQSDNRRQDLNSPNPNNTIAADAIILPQMDSFPFYDTVPQDIFVSYYKTFERNYQNRPFWLKGEFISRKLGYTTTPIWLNLRAFSPILTFSNESIDSLTDRRKFAP